MSACNICGTGGFDSLDQVRDHIRLAHPKVYQAQASDIGGHESSLHIPEGRKFDQDKPRYDLIPFKALAEIVAVLTHGAKKYAPDNWRQVQGWRWRYFGAALRHTTAWFAGEKIDPESGHKHLAHAVCCLMFALELDR